MSLAAGSQLSRRSSDQLDIRTLLTVLSVVWFGLVLASLAQELLRPDTAHRLGLLDVDDERSLYTWFSQLMLAGAAAWSFKIASEVRTASRSLALQWLLLALALLALSADESISVHDLVWDELPAAWKATAFGKLWVIPLGAASVMALVLAIPFLRNLPNGVRRLFLLAAFVFLAGGIGMQLAGELIYEAHGQDITALPVRLAAVLEEALEGLGVLIFFFALALYRSAPPGARDPWP